MTLDDQGNDGARIATIVSVFPELRDAQFKSTSGGWDSVALTANDRLIFKFPRHAAARSALVREAALLGVIRPQLTLPVPDMKLHGDPVLFSSHVKIAGEQLLAEQYEMLPEAVRVQLAKTLGQFYAELHALDPMKMVRAGATSIAPWLQVADLRANALPLLPLDARTACEGILSLYAQLAPDPQGLIFGMFDCHGWNMAFDHAAQRLNGVYDFSDSGVGPLHQDFIYPAFVAPELPFRMADYYEQVSGRKIDRARIATLIGAHRLVELAAQADNPPAAELMRANVLNWLRWTAGV